MHAVLFEVRISGVLQYIYCVQARRHDSASQALILNSNKELTFSI